MNSPKHNYLAEINQGIIWHDALQAAVVDEFERLFDELIDSQPAQWFWQKQTPAPTGIYIYGSVGRGKTHLMDLFYDSLPEQVGKQRQHYHEFMLWLHRQLRSHHDTQDPLNLICKQLAKRTQILCLDEFLVNDIANAMLLSGLLKAFSRYGIALVTTSNVKPDDLYLDGLQRAQFMPAIAWIKRHMQIKHLDGDQDYRQQSDNQHEHWYFPINASSQIHLEDGFNQTTIGHPVVHEDWQINDRPLRVVKSTDECLWCDFTALCQTPRNAADYITIAKQINTLVIANIPTMTSDDDSAARRFITLIDVMYEHEVKIIAQAAGHYQVIYQGQKMSFEFERAASRLAELLI